MEVIKISREKNSTFSLIFSRKINRQSLGKLPLSAPSLTISHIPIRPPSIASVRRRASSPTCAKASTGQRALRAHYWLRRKPWKVKEKYPLPSETSSRHTSRTTASRSPSIKSTGRRTQRKLRTYRGLKVGRRREKGLPFLSLNLRIKRSNLLWCCCSAFC